jgi:hypothetical protein
MAGKKERFENIVNILEQLIQISSPLNTNSSSYQRHVSSQKKRLNKGDFRWEIFHPNYASKNFIISGK